MTSAVVKDLKIIKFLDIIDITEQNAKKKTSKKRTYLTITINKTGAPLYTIHSVREEKSLFLVPV